MRKSSVYTAIAGAAAGIVNGLFGASGGMILVPMLTKLTDLDDREVFPASISIILPMCIITLLMQAGAGLPFRDALPYLIGSVIGGLLAGVCGKKVPTVWLHRVLGVLILWGGWRYLC